MKSDVAKCEMSLKSPNFIRSKDRHQIPVKMGKTRENNGLIHLGNLLKLTPEKVASFFEKDKKQKEMLKKKLRLF